MSELGAFDQAVADAMLQAHAAPSGLPGYLAIRFESLTFPSGTFSSPHGSSHRF